MTTIVSSWKTELVHEIYSNSYKGHISFVDNFVDSIPGPNRDAKIKRVKRFVEKELSKKKNIVLEEKETIVENKNIFEATNVDLNCKPNSVIKFGLISDTHFNSKYVQLTHLNKFYDICKEQGITNVYHAGDIDDGENMRPGHVYENYNQGADEHLQEIITKYPYREGITTHFITGNHDSSFRKHCGLDIGKLIESKRQDMKYLGRDIAVVNITDKVSMMLKHPWDTTAYALSYKPQKIIEALCNTSMKPSILAIGHYHKIEYLYYLGVHCLQTGCFQSSTPFTIGKGIRVMIGGWIITVTLDDKGNIQTFTPQAVTFDNEIKDDYKNF